MTPTALSYLTMAAVAVALCGLPLFALAVALARAARDVQPTRPDEGEWEGRRSKPPFPTWAASRA